MLCLLAAVAFSALDEREYLGVDLGTEVFRAAVAVRGRSRLVLNEMSERTFLGAVGWRDGGAERLLCETARQGHVVAEQVRDAAASEPHNSTVLSDTLSVTNEESLAMTLQHIWEAAGKPPHPMAISIPPYFTSAQRHYIIDSASLTQMKHDPRIISEPTAVALAYSSLHDYTQDPVKGKVLFVSVSDSYAYAALVRYTLSRSEKSANGRLLMQKNAQILSLAVSRTVSVKTLVRNFIKEVPELAEIGVERYSEHRGRVKKAVEMLTSRRAAEVSLEGLGGGRVEVTREKFEEANYDVVEKLKSIIKTALKRAKVGPSGLGSVELVGGGTRIPFVQAAIQAATKKPNLHHRLDKDESPAFGAATYAYNITSPDATLPTVRPFTPLTYTVSWTGAGEDEEGEADRTATLPPSPLPSRHVFNVTTDSPWLVVSITQGGAAQGTYNITGIRQTHSALCKEHNVRGEKDADAKVVFRVMVKENGLVEVTRAKVSVLTIKVVEVKKPKKGGKKQAPMSQKVEEEKGKLLDVTQLIGGGSNKGERAAESKRKLGRLLIREERRRELAGAKNDLEMLLYDVAEAFKNFPPTIPTELTADLEKMTIETQKWYESAEQSGATTHDYNHKHLSLTRAFYKVEQAVQAVESTEDEEEEEEEEEEACRGESEEKEAEEGRDEDPLHECLAELHEVKKELHAERETNAALRRQLRASKG